MPASTSAIASRSPSAGDAAAVAAIGIHRELIAGETLATSLEAREAETARRDRRRIGSSVTIEVERA